MQKDSVEYMKKCEKCQKHAPIVHQPATELHPIISPWPFAMWRLDIIGPLPRGVGNKKFLLVSIDYFMKWVEAVPLANIANSNVKMFLWKILLPVLGSLKPSYRKTVLSNIFPSSHTHRAMGLQRRPIWLFSRD